MVKHVWVVGHEGLLPGLLIRWHQVASGWQGYVTHPVRDGEGWILIDEWLPANRLRPVAAPIPDSTTPQESGHSDP